MSVVNWDNSERRCEWCGKLYTPKAPNQVCCSKKCRMERKNHFQSIQPRNTRNDLSPNMLKIMELVRNDPNYTKVQMEEMKGGHG